MGLLGFERGVSILAQLVGFDPRARRRRRRWRRTTARSTTPCSATGWPGSRSELEVMRFTALRSLSAVTAGDDSSAGGGAASIFKLVWANWHKRLGEVAMDVRGLDGLVAARARAVRARRLAAAVPVLPLRHDLRRQRRGAAQHPGRARARPAPRTQGDRVTTHQSRAARPRLRARPRPAGRQGRRGDGGGRGRHRRRRRAPGARGGREGGGLQRHPRAPAGRGRGGAGRGVRRGPGAVSWSATSPTRRRCRRCSTRPTSLGGVDVMVNNAGLGGTASRAGDDRRPVVQGPRHHPDRHVPVRARGRPAVRRGRARRA